MSDLLPGCVWNLFDVYTVNLMYTVIAFKHLNTDANKHFKITCRDLRIIFVNNIVYT